MYIEERPEWIKAIHETLCGRWYLLSMGFHSDTVPDCDLCELRDKIQEHLDINEMCKSDPDGLCPLQRAGHCCNEEDSLYNKWANKVAKGCNNCEFEDNCDDIEQCPENIAPEEAEAMVEALIALLPEEEQKRYNP